MVKTYNPRGYITALDFNYFNEEKIIRPSFIKFLQDEIGGNGKEPWSWQKVVTVRNKINRITRDKSWH